MFCTVSRFYMWSLQPESQFNLEDLQYRWMIRAEQMVNSITYTPCLRFHRCTHTHTHKTLIFQGPWFGFCAYHHGNLALTLNMLDGQQNSLENHVAVSIDFKFLQKTYIWFIVSLCRGEPVNRHCLESKCQLTLNTNWKWQIIRPKYITFKHI